MLVEAACHAVRFPGLVHMQKVFLLAGLCVIGVLPASENMQRACQMTCKACCYLSFNAKEFFISSLPGGFTEGTADILDGGHNTWVTLPSISASGTCIRQKSLE